MLLAIKNLHVSFPTPQGILQAVRDVSFTVSEGETVAIVGESGCGKSVTALAIKGLINPRHVESGEIIFKGNSLLQKSKKEREAICGKEMGMIFQDPMTSLNPTMRIGRQIVEGALIHRKIGRKEAYELAIDLLGQVGIANPEKRATQYPHEFSGGMRQRAVIAMAIACRPKLLIADEPTTALDVTIQAQILELLKEIQRTMGTSIIFITHDLGLVAGMCDRVLVMYAGKIVESGSVNEVYSSPKHPYTQGLLRSVFRLDMDRSKELMTIEGSPPTLLHATKGCSFYKRCSHAMRICKLACPPTHQWEEGRTSCCWLHHD